MTEHDARSDLKSSFDLQQLRAALSDVWPGMWETAVGIQRDRLVTFRDRLAAILGECPPGQLYHRYERTETIDGHVKALDACEVTHRAWCPLWDTFPNRGYCPGCAAEVLVVGGDGE